MYSLPLILFFSITFFLALLIIGLAFIIGPKKPGVAKLSGYECGFAPFKTARFPFNIRFSLIAILFIIFDMEIALFLPFALALKQISLLGFFSFIGFFILLTLGFVYEWQKGAFKWD